MFILWKLSRMLSQGLLWICRRFWATRDFHRIYFCFFFKRFYLFINDREREREAETQSEWEGGPCPEPDVGHNPGMPRWHPGSKGGAKPLSHPGIQNNFVFILKIYLFIQESYRGRGRNRLRSKSLMQDTIPGTQDHNHSQLQTLNLWATQVPWQYSLF